MIPHFFFPSELTGLVGPSLTTERQSHLVQYCHGPAKSCGATLRSEPFKEDPERSGMGDLAGWACATVRSHS